MPFKQKLELFLPWPDVGEERPLVWVLGKMKQLPPAWVNEALESERLGAEEPGAELKWV